MRRSPSSVQWSDPWIKRSRASDPADFPRALSNRGLQYSFSRAPARGMVELLDSYRRSAWLQAVVNRIGYHFAIVPWQLHERPDRSAEGKRLSTKSFQRLSAGYRHKSINSASRLGDLKMIDSHPLLDLLDEPNSEMAGVAFRDLCCKFMDFTGECFQLVVRDALGTPYQIWPLSPSWVTRIPTADEPSFDFSVLGVNMQIPRESIVYMRRHELLNPYGRGTGIGVSLDDTVDIDDYAHKFLKGFYFNGARPDMIISLPGASEEVISDFQMKFENQTRGAARAHRTFFADEEIKVDELKNEAGAEQSLPILNYSRDTFISVFGVPPEIMGVLGSSNRATVNQAMTIFARETLMPRLELFGSEWQRQLVPLFDENLLLSYVNPVPEDDDFRLDVARSAPWSLSVREWRQLGGLSSPEGEFDYYMIPVGLTATDDPSTPILAPGQPNVSAPAAPSMPAEGPQESARFTRPRIKADGEDDDSEAQASADRALESFDPDYLTEELDPVWLDSMASWGNDVMDELKVDARFDLQNPRVKKHLQEFRSRMDGVNDSTQERLRGQLVEGFKAGDDYRAMADRVQSVLGDDRSHAESVARTEVTRSSNFASVDAYRQSELVSQKQWIATVSDDRTRDAHLELANEVVGIDEDFEVDGEHADFPGDFGVPELDVNCRCAIAPVVDEPKSVDAKTIYWKKYDAARNPWEKKAQKAVLTAWNKQARPILRSLQRLL